ncbi:MAG: hypothetical protein ACN4G0_01240 [Polyangiales bacterium]
MTKTPRTPSLLASILFLSAALSLAISGCDSSNGAGLTRLLGQALAPESDGDENKQVPLENGTVVMVEFDDEGNVVSAEVGTTDANGNFQVDVNAQAVVAVVVKGSTDDGDTEISGLFNPEQTAIEKDLDAGTSIACVAGIDAVVEGSITDEELDETRVQNLEDAADEYLEANPDFDYYDDMQVSAAVTWVRTATNDGANPAP